MARIKTITRSFAGGEITSELYGRLDLGKYPVGVARLENFIPKPQGPAQFRPGLGYVNEALPDSRLIPFAFSQDQTLVIELGAGVTRFHTGGGSVLETALDITAITQANPGVFTIAGHGYTTGDSLFITNAGPVNAQYVSVNVIDANTFTVTRYGAAAPVNMSAFAYGGNGAAAARVYTVSNPYSAQDLFQIDYGQSADVVTLVHPNYPPYELRRSGPTSWAMAQIAFGTDVASPTAVILSGTGTGTKVYRYVVTATDATGISESLASNPGIGPKFSITAITKANPGVLTTGTTHGLAVNDTIWIQDIVGMVELNNRLFVVGTVPTTTTLTLLDRTTLIPVDTTGYTTWVSGGTVSRDHVKNDLTTAGNSNLIRWTASANAAQYNVYRETTQDSGLYGFIGSAALTTFTDNNLLPLTAITPPTDAGVFETGGNYPGAVSYIDQRRVFAATTRQPQTLFMSRPGKGSNFNTSFPTVDSDGIEVTLSSGQQDRIQFLVAFSELIALSTGAVWKIASSSGEGLTPANITARPQAFAGAAGIKPVRASSSIIYAQYQTPMLREVGFDFNSQSHKAQEISVLAPALFTNHTLADMTFAPSPIPTIWAVRDDGVMVALTYSPDADVRAFWRLLTAGRVRSVTAVAEGGESAVYVRVARTVNGTARQFIERLGTMYDTDRDSGVFLDAAINYSGPPTTTIIGADHLEGATVSVLADGRVTQGLTVVDGSVTLPVAASVVALGLPYTGTIETLPVPTAQSPGDLWGTQLNPRAAYLRVYNTAGVQVGGVDSGDLTPLIVEDPYTPALHTGTFYIPMSGAWGNDARLLIVQDLPLSCVVLGYALEVEVGG